VNVVAPGIDILSTIPNYYSNYFQAQTNYASFSGTSMAAPHVTGLAGLILSMEYYEPNLIRDLIQKTSKDLGTIGYDTVYGWGRINAYAALTNVNLKPLNCSVSNYNNRPKVTWNRNNNSHPEYGTGYFNKYLVYKGTRLNENVIYEKIATLDTNVYSYTALLSKIKREL
jgi:subtilisin family serine protease